MVARLALAVKSRHRWVMADLLCNEAELISNQLICLTKQGIKRFSSISLETSEISDYICGNYG